MPSTIGPSSMKGIILRPMTKDEFDLFYERDIRHYAEENVAAGRWARSEALKLSKEAHEQLLPAGRRTKGNYFYVAEDALTGSRVGVAWLSRKAKEAFLFDIEVDVRLRGKGLGRLVLRAVERKAKDLTADSLSLHVFCKNRRAFSLYVKGGYKMVSANMTKRL